MGTLDKEKLTYSKRTPKTIAPFPELNSEALGWVYKRLSGEDQEQTIDQNDPQASEKQEHLDRLLKSKDFAGLYAFAQVETAGKLNRESIEGEWRKYDQGGDWRKLEGDLKGKGTGWCTAEGSAEGHLQGGDFYVYYTKNADGQYTEPRVAIRMEGDQVGEIRGVNQRQELEPELVDIAQQEYHAFPGGEKYDKKAADMKQMTLVYKKHQAGDDLSKDELIFLYEINSQIEGFDYDRDSRVAEVRSQRDPKADAPIVLDCQPNEIAWNQDQIHKQTKNYIGPLFAGIFQMPNLENIYTSFPEGRIRKSELEIGSKTKDELVAELKAKGIKIYDYAQDMLDRVEYTTQPNPEQINTIRLKVQDLGFLDGATTDQIYAKAEEFGLELCPAVVGPYQRSKDQEQPLDDCYTIAMKQIADRRGVHYVFDLEHYGDCLWLKEGWAEPDRKWNAGSEFMFRLRQVSQAT